MKLLCVGDVHTNVTALQKLIKNHANQGIQAVLQVGDFELYQSKEAIKQEQKYLFTLKKRQDAQKLRSKLLKKQFKPFEIPVYYIKGNHDDFEHLDSEYLQYLNIHYIEQGDILNIGGINIAGVGGIHSPIKSSMKSEDLHGHDKRFYTCEEVEKVVQKSLSDKIDILLTHQAASGVMPEKSQKRFKPTWDEGTKDFVKLLNIPKLRWYIHGHHHVNYKNKVNGVQCIGLGNFNKNNESYYIIEIGE